MHFRKLTMICSTLLFRCEQLIWYRWCCVFSATLLPAKLSFVVNAFQSLFALVYTIESRLPAIANLAGILCCGFCVLLPLMNICSNITIIKRSSAFSFFFLNESKNESKFPNTMKKHWTMLFFSFLLDNLLYIYHHISTK